jgi:CBS domain-containing protein
MNTESMRIGEYCVRDVIVAPPETNVQESAVLMRRHHVGSIVVVRDFRVPIGIVTDRDIVVEVIAKGRSPSAWTLQDIMAPQLVTVRESESLIDTIRTLRERRVRRAPVLDASGALAGLVALDDLLEVLAEEMGELARLVSRSRMMAVAAGR